MKVIIKNVRGSFLKIFKPGQYEDNDPRYEGTFLFDKDSDAHKTIEEAIDKVGREQWADKWKTLKKTLEASGKWIVKDGVLKESIAGYSGKLFIKATNSSRPDARDRKGVPTTAEDGIVYSGAYFNAIVDIWPQANKWGNRVNAKLLGIQFVKDGEAFSSEARAEDSDYEELAETGADDLA